MHTSASLYPAISEADLLGLPFPLIPECECKRVVQCVSEAYLERHRASELLAAAQRAVEIAIEQDEAAALAHLASHGVPS